MEEQEKGAWTIFSLGKWDLNYWELDMHQRSGMDLLGIQGCTPPPPTPSLGKEEGASRGGGGANLIIKSIFPIWKSNISCHR